MVQARPLAKLGEPKTRAYFARRANKVVLLYRRRRNETWLMACEYGDGKGKNKRPKFRVGSRFNGRFYPGRCGLSPSGENFVYFVMGGHQPDVKEQYYCWTAICRPPQISAEFLIPHDDTWSGGGAFLDDRNLIVFCGAHHSENQLAEINKQIGSGLKVFASDMFGEIPEEAQKIKFIDHGWRGTAGWEMLAGRWWKSCGKATLLAQYRDDWQKYGGFDCYRLLLVDQKRNPLLSDETMHSVQWADFDHLDRLWLVRGQHIEIYNKSNPRDGDKPNQVIDLEHVLEKERARA